MVDHWLSKEEKAYYRKRLWRNIVQLFFGTILLLFAYFQLQQSTAEKMSISSGVEVLSQKVQLRFHNIVNKDGNAYQEKLGMEKNYAEVINVVQNSSCKEKVDAQALVNMYSQLKNDDVPSFVQKKTEYNNFLIDFYRQVKEVCSEEVYTQQ